MLNELPLAPLRRDAVDRLVGGELPARLLGHWAR
jgi:hypothetical protein